MLAIPLVLYTCWPYLQYCTHVGHTPSTVHMLAIPPVLYTYWPYLQYCTHVGHTSSTVHMLAIPPVLYTCWPYPQYCTHISSDVHVYMQVDLFCCVILCTHVLCFVMFYSWQVHQRHVNMHGETVCFLLIYIHNSLYTGILHTDGSLYLCTPIDPLFLALPLLLTAAKVGTMCATWMVFDKGWGLQTGKFTTLDAIFEDTLLKVLEKCVQTDQWGHICDVKSKISLYLTPSPLSLTPHCSRFSSTPSFPFRYS